MKKEIEKELENIKESTAKKVMKKIVQSAQKKLIPISQKVKDQQEITDEEQQKIEKQLKDTIMQMKEFFNIETEEGKRHIEEEDLADMDIYELEKVTKEMLKEVEKQMGK